MKTEELLGLLELLGEEEEKKAEDEALEELIGELLFGEEEKEAEEDEVLDALIKLLAKEEEEKEAEDKVEDLLVNYLIKEAAKKKRKKTYPISRALTSPITGATYGGVAAGVPGLLALLRNNPRAALKYTPKTVAKILGIAALGSGIGYGGTLLDRLIYARARRGRKARGKGLYRFERD